MIHNSLNEFSDWEDYYFVLFDLSNQIISFWFGLIGEIKFEKKCQKFLTLHLKKICLYNIFFNFCVFQILLKKLFTIFFEMNFLWKGKCYL